MRGDRVEVREDRADRRGDRAERRGEMCGHESFIILGTRVEIFIPFFSQRREKGNSVYPS